MARPKAKDEGRGCFTSIRWMVEERARLEKAQAASLSRAEYVRRQALTGRVTIREARPANPGIVAALRRLGSAIDASLRTAHTHRRLPEDLSQSADLWRYTLAVLVPDAREPGQDEAVRLARIGHNLVQFAGLADETGAALPPVMSALRSRLST